MAPASIELSAASAQALTGAARAAWPLEMVGLLGGTVARRPDGDVWLVQHFLPLPGAACARDRFAVTPHHFATGEAELRGMGLAWLGFAHSHPDGAAAPSARDRAELWRDCLQLIVAVHGERDTARERSVQLAAFWPTGGDFVPVQCCRGAATAAP